MPPKQTKVPGATSSAPPTGPVATYDWSSAGSTGFEHVRQEDLGIPFLSIIQKGSPQFDRDHKDHASKRIEGCDVGDIFNSVTNEVVCSAGDEITFIPCGFQKLYVEWKTREHGGGIVKSHPDSTILLDCKRNERGQDILPNGNLIATTSYFYGIALIDGEQIPCIIGLTSTQLKKGKQWLNIATSIRVQGPGDTKICPPLYSHTYLLSTTAEKNEAGNWRGWVVRLGTMQTDPMLIAKCIEYSKSCANIQRQLSAPPSDEVDNPANKHM
jgi:hypothetical protein